MIIYGALLIPFITAAVLYWFFYRKVTWWEFLIPFAFSIILVVLMKVMTEYIEVRSKEYWGSFITQVDYYEDWNEYIHQICTRPCCCDSEGNNCSTEIYDCSYVQYHSPTWTISTTTGEYISIDQTGYNRIKAKFGNETYQDMHRNYHTDDGDMYYTLWQRDSLSSISVTTLHYYENRVKAADQSVFNFKPLENDDIVNYQLKSYPDITNYYEMDAVMGDISEDAKIANKKLKYLNASLGHKKEVRVFVLVFKNQPIEAGFYQEWYWSGGNMNEFVVAIGIDNDRNVKWCKPISWTTNEKLKVDVKSYVQNQEKLNLSQIADYLLVKIDSDFARRDFKEFDYLTVEPPTWAIILTFILVLIVNLGLSYWIITNEHEDSAARA